MAKIFRRAVASSFTLSSSVNNNLKISAKVTPSLNAAEYGNANAYIGKPAYQRLLPPEHIARYVGSTAFSDHQRGSNAATTTDKNDTKHYTAKPTLIDGVDSATPVPPYLQNKTVQAEILAAERERIRAEFFATYDVMTGVRIAATLSGFFGLMVFLIVWKSRSSSNETMKVLKDPKMAAVAAVCMQEEEERVIQEAMVATGMSIYPDEYDAIVYRRQRMMSLGNVSAPPMLNRSFRFSSVGGGGYSSLLEPCRRFSYSAASAAGSLGGSGRRKSGSESSRMFSHFQMGSSFGNDDYFMETDDEIDNGGDYSAQQKSADGSKHTRGDSVRSKHGFLEVPVPGQDSRRSSAMTCCSTDSSYLERRCSAFTLGLSNLPPSLQRKLSTASRTSSTDNWDYFYPDIQVIQPTPKQSPCPSERSIYDQLHETKTTVDIATATTTSSALASFALSKSKTGKPQAADNTLRSVPSSSKNIISDKGIKTPLPFVRKHSIAYYDPESAQAGRKQKIHSISADTVDVYPYNQTSVHDNDIGPVQSGPPAGIHQGFHFTESPMEELFLNIRRKIAVAESERDPPTQIEQVATIHHPPTFENNNNFPYTSSATALKARTAANSSSISIDSIPISIDKLNGSSSLGTVSAKALFNVEKRAPLASLSSFKISSIDYPDSEMRSLDEDSVFLDSVADTDEDMQQLSSDSEEPSLGEQECSNYVYETNIIQTGTAPMELDTTASTSRMAAARLNQSQKFKIEKRLSLGASTTNRLRRPQLQRHRTISVSSNDRISLISGQPLKEFPKCELGDKISSSIKKTQAPQKSPPLETHFGSVVCTSSPPTHPRRAQLMQQYSDPQSMPTTTTTGTTEDDTCSTLNTELYGNAGNVGACEDTDSCRVASRASSGMTSGDCGSVTQTQRSSLNTVVSFGRLSPLTDNNNVTSCRGTTTTSPTPNEPVATNLSSGSKTKDELPRCKFSHDACASSTSDSVISSRHPIISMPASLKNLILRRTGTTKEKTEKKPQISVVSRSAINLNNLDSTEERVHFVDDAFIGQHSPTQCQVTLELPLIKLPTDDSSESSSASNGGQDSRSKSHEDTHDPSLGSSRKWSKETLF